MVDLFGAGKGHPVLSEFVVSSEGAAQPEGTWTGSSVFGGCEGEILSLSCMNCRQSGAVVEVFNMSFNSYNSIFFQFRSLAASDVIASSVEHHSSLRELTVGNRCSWSLSKGAVEGMARRHGVEKLLITQEEMLAETGAFPNNAHLRD